MRIHTKRWNDPAAPEDGFRVLVCRYRPRGVSREKEVWDVWLKDLGPSEALHAAFWGKERAPIHFEEYRARYLQEMGARTGLVTSLRRRAAAGEVLTLLCSSACTDSGRCHRTLLKALIEAGVR